MSDSPDDRFPAPPALTGAALASAVSVFLIVYTESYDPGGSALAPLFVVMLIAAHLPLARSAGVAKWLSGSIRFSPKAVVVFAGLLIVAATALYVFFGQQGIFTQAVRGRGSAQLGMVTQVVAHIETGQPVYSERYERDGFTEANGFPMGLILPYATARAWGFDWRYASLASIMFLGALLVAGIVVINKSGAGDSVKKIAILATSLTGCAWLFIPEFWPYINWGHTIPLWPVIAWLGLSIAARWHVLTALLAGILAAMNPGWILMLPVLAVFLWRETGQKFLPIGIVMLAMPLLAYGAHREYFFEMMEGILGNTFLAGDDHDKLNAWRYMTLNGVGDFLNMRYGIYILGLVSLVLICIQIARRESLSDRIQLVALAAFVIVICGPQAYFFHWAAHCVFLASLIPAVVLAGDPVYTQKSKKIFQWSPIGWGSAAAAACLVILYIQFQQGFPDTLKTNGVARQEAPEKLLGGFNVPSADHAWGKDTAMEVGFTLEQVKGGFLELELGTLGGDFTPYNPIWIRVNGHQKGMFRAPPGDSKFVRIPLKPGDVHVGYNVLELQTRWARTPRSVNVADDHRTVSVRYGGMAYIPTITPSAR